MKGENLLHSITEVVIYLIQDRLTLHLGKIQMLKRNNIENDINCMLFSNVSPFRIPEFKWLVHKFLLFKNLMPKELHCGNLLTRLISRFFH